MGGDDDEDAGEAEDEGEEDEGDEWGGGVGDGGFDAEGDCGGKKELGSGLCMVILGEMDRVEW